MKYLATILIILLPSFLTAQQVTGKVRSDEKEALVGANIYWVATNIGTTTDGEGIFNLSTEGVSTKQLVASYIGYESDTILVKNKETITFQLSASNTLAEVTVSGQQDAVIISYIKAIKSEQITQTSLRQAACCDLAGCFGGQSTVTPQTTNVVTNAKELRILGLSGVYNQVLICLLYTSPSPRDATLSRMPSSA